MVKTDNIPVRFSRGKKNFGRVKNRTLPWGHFKSLFREAPRSGETLYQYNKLTEAEQRDKKSAEGYWFRSATEGEIRRRDTALPSDLITLDFDYATPEFFESIRLNKPKFDFSYFIHTSRRHTPEKPRFRMVILNAEPVPNDQYPAVSRIVAHEVDPEMKHVDPVSFRPAQMMFMPTASKDSEYVFAAHDGDGPLDWQTRLAVFEATIGDWRDITKLPTVAGEKLRETSEKAENPTEKEGPVGDFCRAYDVMEAIEAFDLPYEPVDAPSAKPRYTYTGGTTVNGAEVQDDGLFLYSHHGSDPVSDQLVNAFDLTRIHKFGHLDKDFDGDGKKPSDFPSWKAMLEFIEKDEKFQKSRLQSRYDLTAMFDSLWEEDQIEIEEAEEDEEIARLVGTVTQSESPDADLLDDMGLPVDQADPELPSTPASRHGHIGISERGIPYLKEPRKRRPRPSKDWTSNLEVNRNGEVLNNVANVTMILKHDLRFRDSMAFNLFSQKPVIIRPIRHRIEWLDQFDLDRQKEITGEPWQDSYDDLIRVILESANGPGKHGWGMKVSDRDLKSAVRIGCRSQSFHPIREVLESFVHDGEARAESLFIDYLGCPDDTYHRQAAKLWLVAAVARIYEPGHKFDFCPVLVGPQGCGKSTFASTLAMGFFGELNASFHDTQKLAEEMLDRWIMEMPELVSMTRSEVEPAKQFISATTMTVRMAYDRHPTEYPRQCVFIGTTNNIDFLKDDTGNRRFWPIRVNVSQIDVPRLCKMVPQVWAEALLIYRKMRAEQPHGHLPLFLDRSATEIASDLQEQSRRPTEADTLAEQVYEILTRPIQDERFGDLPDNGSTEKYFEIVTPGLIRDLLGDAKISTQLLAAALQKCKWRKRGGRERISGIRGSAYVPTEEFLAERQELINLRNIEKIV